MFRQRLFHGIVILIVAFSVVAGSFVARVAVQQAVAQSEESNASVLIAQSPLQELQQAGRGYTGGSTKPPRDLRLVVAGFIRMGLGLVGITMICLMLYAGFMWFSARGNDEQVQKAKDTIRNAVIGMVLVAMTYSLVTFIFRSVFVSAGSTAPQCQGFLENVNPFAGCQ